MCIYKSGVKNMPHTGTGNSSLSKLLVSMEVDRVLFFFFWKYFSVGHFSLPYYLSPDWHAWLCSECVLNKGVTHSGYVHCTFQNGCSLLTTLYLMRRGKGKASSHTVKAYDFVRSIWEFVILWKCFGQHTGQELKRL